MMTRQGLGRLVLMAAATLAVAACDGATDANAKKAAGGQAQGGAAQSQDWRQTVVATPEGGFRMGNPDARVKLVEYASFTCTHCRDFHLESSAALKDGLVRSGRVSYEYRPFLLNGVDAVVALAAQCAGPQRFFVWADQLYRNHDAWVLPFTKIDPATSARLGRLPAEQQLAAFAAAGGFDAFARLRGLPSARLNQCLGDQAAFQRLQNQMQRGQEQFNITGTPTFVLNGERVDGVANWAGLEPKIRALL